MIIDSSAILSIFFNEQACESLLDAMLATSHLEIGAPTLVETGIVIAARTPLPESRLTEFIDELGATVTPFGINHYREAVRCWQKYGRGRHAASLNFGDCLTYAIARIAGLPILCTGNDFSKTDAELVPY